jgi:hypothetical protein
MMYSKIILMRRMPRRKSSTLTVTSLAAVLAMAISGEREKQKGSIYIAKIGFMAAAAKMITPAAAPTIRIMVCSINFL